MEIIEEIIQFMSNWHIWEIIVIVASILLTMLVKLPIKKAAVKWEEKYGIDKSKITWINAMFPYVFSFIAVFVLYWYETGFNMELKDPEWWKEIAMKTAALGSGAIGLYELVKKIKQAILATMEKAKLDKESKEETNNG